eukprot:3132155-Karenia_brevis.AAC.1
MQDTLLTAVPRATTEVTQEFEARLTKAVYGLSQGSAQKPETVSDTGDHPQGSASSCTPPITYILI